MDSTSAAAPDDPANSLATSLEISFPNGSETRDQDEEWCEVVIDGERRRIRFHDYDEIYSIPGLYERLFYEELRCRSPRTVREMLAETIEEEGLAPEELRVLDVGAGNGIVAEELSELGVGSFTGVDIIDEAAEAARRDRPGLYDDYVVVDLTDIPEEVDETLGEIEFNCMTTVAALGYGDIPPEAFAGGYRYLADGGLVGMTIKSDFVSGPDTSGFAELIKSSVDVGAMDVKRRREFTHRLSAAGEPISYVAIVAEKQGELPPLAGPPDYPGDLTG